jgi:hypothetical protein
MSTAHDVWTTAETAYRSSTVKPANLLLPGTRFTFFAFSAIVAGTVLALMT